MKVLYGVCQAWFQQRKGVRQPVLAIKQISGLEYFLLAYGQVHSFNWIYAADCQGKVSSLNMVLLHKEEVKHVASSAVKSDYGLLNETGFLCCYIFLEHHLTFCENLSSQVQA